MTAESRLRRLNQHKINAYRRLYEFTRDMCGDCSQTDCACKDSICSHVESQALRNGIALKKGDHPRLRFIGCEGCTVPPHLRETCTIYLCAPAQAREGFPKERYERLKNHCAVIEMKLMALQHPDMVKN